MSKPKKRKVTSGPSQTEEQRAANGWGRLSLRLRTKTLDKLEALVESSGCTKSQLIETMIELDYESLP